jgi:hypothetical protein
LGYGVLNYRADTLRVQEFAVHAMRLRQGFAQSALTPIQTFYWVKFTSLMVSTFRNRRYIPVGNGIRSCKKLFSKFLQKQKRPQGGCKALSGASTVWIQ